MPAACRYACAEDLRRFTTEVFTRHGLSDDDARQIAQDLVEADLRGVDSHGVARIPIYAERLRRKAVNPGPKIRVERTTAAVAHVDGDHGMGFVVGRRAMAEAIAMAQEAGVGLVGIKRSTHYGMAALYVMQAVEAGMIGLAFTNSSPAMPVWGGRSLFLGASPFAAAAPAKRNGAFVLDMAMTVTARGKVRLAAERGEAIAPGIALDAEGRPTTDARAAMEGVLLPFGGAKGSGFAMLMEVMAGVLTGAAFGGDVKSLYFDFSGPQDVGHLFIAIRPDLFMPKDMFLARMDVLIERAKACPPAAGFEEVMVAGEPEARTRAARALTGIPLSAEVYEALRNEADACDVKFPEVSSEPLAPAEPHAAA